KISVNSQYQYLPISLRSLLSHLPKLPAPVPVFRPDAPEAAYRLLFRTHPIASAETVQMPASYTQSPDPSVRTPPDQPPAAAAPDHPAAEPNADPTHAAARCVPLPA